MLNQNHPNENYEPINMKNTFYKKNLCSYTEDEGKNLACTVSAFRCEDIKINMS